MSTVPAARPRSEPDGCSLLIELHQVLLDHHDLRTSMQRVAALAARAAVPGSSGVIALQRCGHPLTVASSDALGDLLHALEDRLGQGPCLRCLRWRQPVRIENLAEDARWPVFALQAAGTGVRSCLCLPLAAPGMTGALTLYAAAPNAFGDEQIRQAETFAEYATGALILAARQDAYLAAIDQLRAALSSRGIIDQALGIIMSRQRCPSRQALAMLRGASQNRNIKLHELALHVVAQTSGGQPDSPAFEMDDEALGRNPARSERAEGPVQGGPAH